MANQCFVIYNKGKLEVFNLEKEKLQLITRVKSLAQ